MTMRERIAQGKLFSDYCEGLPEDRTEAKKKMIAINATGPEDIQQRMELVQKTFRSDGGMAWIEPPIYFCYGYNIHFKGMSYVNFNCNFVDDGEIEIGDKVMFGPAVTIATVSHPINPEMRGYMYAQKVTIGDNCWIGAGVTICPGVTIGENSVIGAGSVVTKDIPANSVAVGNPCKVIRQFNEEDAKYYRPGCSFEDDDLDEIERLEGRK